MRFGDSGDNWIEDSLTGRIVLRNQQEKKRDAQQGMTWLIISPRHSEQRNQKGQTVADIIGEIVTRGHAMETKIGYGTDQHLPDEGSVG